MNRMCFLTVLLLLSLHTIAQTTLKERQAPGDVNGDKVFLIVADQPEFPGGLTALREYLKANVQYPSSARQNRIEGKVMTQFVVRRTGEVTDVKILRGLSDDCDREAVRAVKAMPAWKSGSQDGRPVSVQIVLPINYRLEEETQPPPTHDANKDKVFRIVENQPEFPGGPAALTEYLKTNVQYPSSARQNRIEGKVMTQFVVSLKGEVTDVKILRGLSDDCDHEAVRLIKAMPKWKPGRQDGHPVNVQMTLPVNYRLE